MNSDSSELDTSSNSRGIFLPPNVPLRLSSTATANNTSTTTSSATSNNARHHANSKTPSTSTDAGSSSNEFNLNNELNAMLTKNANGPAAMLGQPKYIGGDAAKPQERYVWEMRSRSPNVTPASTVLNSPDLNVESQYTLNHHQRHHQIRVGRSPGSQFEQHNILPQGLTSPGSPTDIDKMAINQQQQQQQQKQHLRDGEIVVFDDIDTNWMNKANANSSTTNAMLSGKMSLSMPHYQQNSDDILKVTKMIGQLPIAEYEGSPRRFGNQPQLGERSNGTGTGNSMPKRPPGFPQRVSPKNPKISAEQYSQQQQQQHHHQQRQQQQEVNARPLSNSEQQQQYYQKVSHNKQQQQQQQHHNYYGPSLVANANSGSNKSIGNLIDIDDDDGGTEQGVCVGSNGAMGLTSKTTPTFDYLYEFSETRKVLEEFFKANPDDEKRFTDFTESGDDLGSCQEDDQEKQHHHHNHHQQQQQHIEQSYIGQRLARIPKEELYMVHRSPKKQQQQPCDTSVYIEHNDIELYIDSNSRSSGDLADTELEANMRRHSRNFTLSPETTDYDSNCGDLDSLSNDINCTTDYGKLYTSMPVLEDGLSSGHASDTENNTCTMAVPSVPVAGDNLQVETMSPIRHGEPETLCNNKNAEYLYEGDNNCANMLDHNLMNELDEHELPIPQQQQQLEHCLDLQHAGDGDVDGCCNNNNNNNNYNHNDALNSCHEMYHNNRDDDDIRDPYDETTTTYASMNASQRATSPRPTSPTAVAVELSTDSSPPRSTCSTSQRQARSKQPRESSDIQEAMKEIRSALQRAKVQPEKLKFCDEVLPADPDSPIWVPRSKNATCANGHKAGAHDDEEPDTDLETDRLLGQQRLDDQAYYDDKTIWPKTSRISTSPLQSNEESPTNSNVGLLLTSPSNSSIKPQSFSSATIRQGIGTSVTPSSPELCQIVGSADVTLTSPEKLQYSKSPTGSIKSLKDIASSDKKAKTRNKEGLLDPAVLIEGVLFRARYLGSTQLVCEGQPTKSTRMMQAEEAVSRIKAPEGESQPSTEVDLFISTEKIMVLNTDLKEIMMDHALRTISYIADIGDLVVLMARRRFVSSDSSSSGDADVANDGSDSTKDRKEPKENGKLNRTPKMICHVFESDEAQFIAQSIGQAFQVAYMEFLKANGIEDHSFVKEMDYQEVLNSQEIFGDELEIFAKKELQKEVVVPKAKGEILGVVIVESGWGSMLPTVVIANLMSTGAAARCGQLNIGDQLIAINGMSLVGLPLSTCQSYIRNAKNQTAVKFTVVPCPPVVEVKIKRPNTKYQLGFSVQNGVICSLLRGGIAERGGVRVGHRIIEINNQSVVAVPHEKIVNLLATSVGEILMKTMPTSMFRLLTGQENPIYI